MFTVKIFNLANSCCSFTVYTFKEYDYSYKIQQYVPYSALLNVLLPKKH